MNLPMNHFRKNQILKEHNFLKMFRFYIREPLGNGEEIVKNIKAKKQNSASKKKRIL